MILRDILLNPEILLLDDNTFVGSQNFDENLPKFESAYSRPVGTFNRIEIWGSKFYGSTYDVYGILNQDKSPKAYIILKPESKHSEWIQAWVEPSERGKKFTLTLINFVIEKLKEKIKISKDELTSTDSRKLIQNWLKLSSQERHFNLNLMLNGEKSTDWDSAFETNVNSYEIILENFSDKKIPLFGAGERVITEFKWY